MPINLALPDLWARLNKWFRFCMARFRFLESHGRLRRFGSWTLGIHSCMTAINLCSHSTHALFTSSVKIWSQSKAFSNSQAFSQLAAEYLQMCLGVPVCFPAGGILRSMVSWTPRWSELLIGGITEQSTLAGEDTRARSIRVDFPVLEVCVGLGTTCVREKLDRIVSSLWYKMWEGLQKSMLKSPTNTKLEK